MDFGKQNSVLVEKVKVLGNIGNCLTKITRNVRRRSGSARRCRSERTRFDKEESRVVAQRIRILKRTRFSEKRQDVARLLAFFFAVNRDFRQPIAPLVFYMTSNSDSVARNLFLKADNPVA